MAAMFQAQTQNWEETQEKMSQLVSRLSGFLVRIVDVSNGRHFLGAFPAYLHRSTVLSAFTQRRAVVHGEGSPFNTTSLTGRSPRVMSVIVAVKKVCKGPLLCSFAVSCFAKVTGSRIVRRTTIGIMTIVLG